ncbi:hypothetical protein N9X61_01395 [Sulfurimonas sp.]|nr:hypothetical protein [Sulfurimonas sp.]
MIEEKLIVEMLQNHKQTFLKGISFSYIYIAVYLITGILTTPMLLNHFQADYFALLMLVNAIITYLNHIRLGLPESLAAMIAKSNDITFNISMVRSSFLLLVKILLLSFIVFFILDLLVDDWRYFLGNVFVLNKENVLSVFYILIIFALIKIPLELSLSIFIGFHEVYLEKIYKILTLLANFSLVFFTIYTSQDIVFYAFLAGLLDLFISIIAFIHMYIKYAVFIKNVSIQKIPEKKLLKDGVLFFQVLMIQTLIWSAGIFFVSHMLSLGDVTTYSLTMKVYIYIFYAFIIVNSVLAPLYGKYFADKSWRTMNQIFNLTIILLPFIGGFVWFSTLYFMVDIIALWTGSNQFYIGSLYVLFMGVFFYFTGYVNSYVTLLYSIGEVKSIVYARYKEVALNLFVSAVLTYSIGLAGIAIGMAFAIMATSARYLPKYLQEKTQDKIFIDFSIQKKHFFFVLLPNVILAFVVTNLIETVVIKLLIFISMSILYIIFSWRLISHEDKYNIISFINKKKVMVEK